MVVMFILVIALLVAVMVIKTKINKVHDTITARVDQTKAVVGKVSTGLSILKHFIKL